MSKELHNTRRPAASEEQGLTLETIRALFELNKKFIIGLCVAGLVSGFVYNRLWPKTYQVNATLLIGSENKAASKLQNVFSQERDKEQEKVVHDQIAILKSFQLSKRTFDFFGWTHRWAKKELFGKIDLYQDEPFDLFSQADSLQLSGIPLRINAINEKEFSVSCSGKVKQGLRKLEIELDTIGRFGEPFVTRYFNFTLFTRPSHPMPDGESYLLEFHQPGAVAMAYRDMITAEPSKDSEDAGLIHLELITANLTRDIDFLNRLIREFIEVDVEEMNRATNSAIELIDQQIAEVNESLGSSGKEFSEFRSKKQTINPGSEATTVFQQKTQLEASRTAIQLKLNYLRNLKFYLENRDRDKDLVAPSLSGSSDNPLTGRITKLNELYGRREVLSYSAQSNSPVMQSLDNEIAFLRKSLVENVENLVNQATIELDHTNNELRAVGSRLSDLPKTEQDLSGIKRNYDLNNQLYTFLLQKRAEAEIARASNRSDVKVVDPASAEVAVLVGPKLLINLVIGLAAGAFLGLGIVLVRTFFSGILLDETEITGLLHATPAGSIVERRYKDRAVVHANPRSSLTESIRGLRINLDHALKSINGKIIAVHAFIPGAGKSFISFNLALMYAGLGKKTLLIDADLRKPTLHQLLETQLSGGLQEYLKDSIQVKDIIRKTSFPDLFFISSGDGGSAPAEQVREKAIAALLEKVRNEFDLIIIDNSPFDIVHDARLIGEQVDANLFLLRINHSTRREVRMLNTLFAESQLKNIIVAVNGRKYRKGYGYGYYVD